MAADQPAPVEVQNVEPIPVAVQRSSDTDTPAQSDARAVAASSQVDAAILATEDQRRISGIWERTQQIIALSVVEAALFVTSVLVLTPALTAIGGGVAAEASITAAIAAMLFLTGVANLVIGFYFGRTNHTRVGGAQSRDGSI